MEMNKDTKISCSHGGEILDYLYDELSPQARERFESHMQGCFECIDEFAELAVSRYSVFEWKSVEFAPLPTPKFVVPTDRTPATASWFSGIRSAFAWNGWALAGAAASVMLLAIIGLALLNIRPDATIAGNDPGQDPDTMTSAVRNIQKPVSDDLSVRPETSVETKGEPRQELTTVRPTVAPRRQTSAAKTVAIRKATSAAANTRRSTASQKLQNSPTLGQYVEDQDDSLRLSDIFDDLDTKDME